LVAIPRPSKPIGGCSTPASRLRTRSGSACSSASRRAYPAWAERTKRSAPIGLPPRSGRPIRPRWTRWQSRSRWGAAKQGLDGLLAAPQAQPQTLTSAASLRSLARLAGGDASGAIEDATQAVSIGEKLRADRPFSIWVGRAKLALGKALLCRGDVRGADAALEAARAQLDGSAGAGHPAALEARRLIEAANQPPPANDCMKSSN